MAPKISVVMPSLNVRRYIEVCMESVIHQTLEDLEIICVDAGSTDGTLEILQDYAKKDSRITLIQSDKKDYGYQVNLGFKAATGDYFAIVETDDLINLQMYEKLYTVAVETGVDLVKANFCRFEIVDGVIQKKYDQIAKPHMYDKILTGEKNRFDIITNASLYTWAGIYKRSFLLENGILHNEAPGASYQDNGFWFQTMAMANTVYFVRDSFYMLRRDNPNSSTQSKEKVYCVRDEYDFVLKYLKERPEVYDTLIPYYWWARFGAYHYTYNRIGMEYKEEFLQHFSKVFTPLWSGFEYDEKLFKRGAFADLKNIVLHPDEYHRLKVNALARQGQKKTLIKRIVWCVEDYGVRYSIKLGLKNCIEKLRSLGKAEQIKAQIVRPVTNHIDKKTAPLEQKLNRLLEENKQLLALLEENQKLLKSCEDRICALEEREK